MIDEEGFRSPLDHPLSTFSIDVDTASYSNVRRLLREGRPPPEGAVRIEELVNYFPYAYPEGAGPHPLAISTELVEAPWQAEHLLLRVAVQARRIEEAAVPPRNLVFLLDVSGSMQSRDKLPLVKRGLRALVERLRPEDSVAIVVYAGASGVVLPPTPGSRRDAILESLERLEAGGSTNAGEGIRIAYALAREHFDPQGINRVVLASDGDFNVGITNRSELVALIEAQRESGVFLTVLGVGRGNLKDATMEQLADRGNGNYAYLDDLAEARKVLVEQAGSTLVTIAKDVKIQVEFNPAHVAAYRLIGYENRRLAHRDFNDDRKDAGEVGAGHSVTALYEVVPVGGEADVGDVDPLRYQRPAPGAAGDHGEELAQVKLRYKQPDGHESLLLSHVVPATPVQLAAASDATRFSSAVALFGMLLRDSDYRGAGDWTLVQQLARGALGEDPSGIRSEFVRLAVVASELEAPGAAAQ